MSNQRKAEIVIGNFCIQSFQDGHGKILPNADLCRKVKSAQFSLIQPPGHSLIAVTHNPLTVWSYEMDHREAERATYEAGTQQSGSFSLFNLQNFGFFPTVVLSSSVFSSLPMRKIPYLLNR
jgi:hypothetical protein